MILFYFTYIYFRKILVSNLLKEPKNDEPQQLRGRGCQYLKFSKMGHLFKKFKNLCS